MSTLPSQHSTRSDTIKLSYSNLEKSRNSALHASGYQSESTCQVLSKACFECCNQVPYEWQLDAAEAFLLGLNCTVLAGTGSGKSLPFVMPAMVQDSIIVVISPLNALEDDQVSRCRKMGLKAIAVHHNTISRALCEELCQLKYQIIYTSPEMVLENPSFKMVLCAPGFHSHLIGIVIDEAHCIVEWGQGFRTVYGQLNKLRSLVPARLPIYATSATVTPKPNIYPKVCTIPNSTTYSAFDFLFDGVTEANQIPRALIFVNRV
ncbi:P-loop containing nucleoside triphosphate hydrolase protein, partial [Boletus edulis]